MREIRKIDQNIDALLRFNKNYEDKKEQLKLKPVKIGYVCLFGTLGSVLAMCNVGTRSLSGLELACFGGYAVGCFFPYTLKKIRIAELDFQIKSNNKIVDDLEKEKVKVMHN